MKGRQAIRSNGPTEVYGTIQRWIGPPRQTTIQLGKSSKVRCVVLYRFVLNTFKVFDSLFGIYSVFR